MDKEILELLEQLNSTQEPKRDSAVAGYILELLKQKTK